ncbi:MAG: hypothetical protein ACI867_001076, partial [Glaciecola sp.]
FAPNDFFAHMVTSSGPPLGIDGEVRTRVSPLGAAGYLAFGAYRALPAGAVEVRAELRIDDVMEPGDVATLELVSVPDFEFLAQQTFTDQDLALPRQVVIHGVNPVGQQVEARLWVTGRAKVALGNVAVVVRRERDHPGPGDRAKTAAWILGIGALGVGTARQGRESLA